MRFLLLFFCCVVFFFVIDFVKHFFVAKSHLWAQSFFSNLWVTAKKKIAGYLFFFFSCFHIMLYHFLLERPTDRITYTGNKKQDPEKKTKEKRNVKNLYP